MKTKDILSPLLFVVLGIAFLAVSFWVWFGRGNNAKAIKAKYKLGGMILSLSFFIVACDTLNPPPPEVTCYMVAHSFAYIPAEWNKDTLSTGDTLFIAIPNPIFKYYSYAMKDSTKVNTLQEGMLVKPTGSTLHIIPIKNQIAYKGKIIVDLYGETRDKVEKKEFVSSVFFNFK